MKKFLLLAMTLLMALSLVAGCGSDSPKKMVIGLDDNFAPMGFVMKRTRSSVMISTSLKKPASVLVWK